MTPRRRQTLIVTAIAGAAVSLSGVLSMSYDLLYNPSESAPRGWYGVVPATSIHVDNFVVVHLSDEAARLAADRLYLPPSVPLLKHVAAMVGQSVCEVDGKVTIDGVFAAQAHRHDGAGRVLVSWSGCRTLAVDELFLLSRSSDASFDSRYFGPVHLPSVLGRAIPLWTW
jgi:conjugative transfer signal peptidase TraF